MPGRPSLELVLKEQAQAYALRQEGFSLSEIMEKMGMGRSAVKRRLDGIRKRMRLDPELAARLQAEGIVDLAGLHSGWLINKDENGAGQSLYFYLGPDGPVSPEEHFEAMSEAFASIQPAPAIKAPRHVETGKVAFFPVADWHLGAVATESEVGADYNREIAIERLRDGFSRCHAALPGCETAIVAYVGDVTHANDRKEVTPKSGNRLKVEGSHFQNVTLACQSVIWQVDMARRQHKNVVVVIRRGNHDEDVPVALTLALNARYEKDPRVTVVNDESPYYVFQKGRLFICMHHGDGQKPEKMALAVPHKFRREWGLSDHHYFFTADKHHTKSDTFGGLHWKQLPALCRLDQYAHHQGYADTGGMMAVLFDTETGMAAEFTVRL